MKYRRNADRETRALEREFYQDISQSQKYAEVLIRSGQLPELPPRWPGSRSASLHSVFQHIDRQYWVQYLALIVNLLRMGIAFELRPAGNCGCENSACQHLTDNTHCFDCSGPLVPLGDYYDLKTARVFHCNCGRQFINPPGIFKCDCGEIPIIISTLQSHDDRGQQILICTQCQERRPLYPPGHGPCSGFAWRSYEDQLGGLCESCMDGYPIDYHSHTCQCRRCNDGVGPVIILRTKLVESVALERMMRAYRHFYKDDLPVNTAFHITHDSQYADEDWRESDISNPSMDALTLSCVELRRDGTYRLRMYDHLNERGIPPRFLGVLRDREAGPILVRGTHGRLESSDAPLALELFRYHMLGRDFNLLDLVSHLAANSPPNMPQFINQVYRAVGEIIGFDAVFYLGRIPANLYDYECLGTWTLPPSPAQEEGIELLVEYPLRIEFRRTAMDDEVMFWLFGTDRVEQRFNTRLREQDICSLQRINQQLHWALDRAQRAEVDGSLVIQPERLTFLRHNMCPHGYQRGIYFSCPHC